jgi:hypothetical protein
VTRRDDNEGTADEGTAAEEQRLAPLATLMRASMENRYGSVRAYAKFRSERDGTTIDDERRRLNKWLKDTWPTKPEHIESLATDLELPRRVFSRPRVNHPQFTNTVLLTEIVRLLERNPDAASGEMRPLLEQLASELAELSSRLRQVIEPQDAGSLDE